MRFIFPLLSGIGQETSKSAKIISDHTFLQTYVRAGSGGRDKERNIRMNASINLLIIRLR